MGKVLGRTHFLYLKFLMEEIFFSFELDLPGMEWTEVDKVQMYVA